MADEKHGSAAESEACGAKSDSQWRAELTREQYEVLRNKGTERPFTGKYNDCKDEGVYRCAGCGNELFNSQTKFDSGTGWPSFFQPLSSDAVREEPDASADMIRTEVMCAKCDGHLGHVFDDGPGPNGRRFCMNSVSLDLKPDDK